ncbi:MAG: hypothetical protein EBR33_13175, partial [Synechococcaceae bacterium WB4_1_0192]|nr:hypothetical protein [Synechococcaceae bacterium WB4_1_0192]
MPLNLIRRLIKGSPLTAADHDGNLDALEAAIDGKEASGAAAAAVAAHTAAADPHPGYLTAAEGNAAYAASGAPAAAVAAHEAAADPHPGYLTAAEGAASFATAAQGAKADAAAVAGAIGSSGLTMTAGILGRETGTGAPQVFTIGANLAIVNGALTATGGGGGGG